ncbi:TNF receptor-associated factor 3 [Pseudoscourfieldia marina]
MAGANNNNNNVVQGGFSSNIFVTKPQENLECSICLLVKRDPVSLCQEGHTFCRDCITRARKPPRFKCPTCRESISASATYTKNRTEKQIIEELLTKCKYTNPDEYATPQSSAAAAPSTASRKRTRGAASSSNGTQPTEFCTWTGPLDKRDAHINECEYALVTCKFAGCHTNVRRKDQGEHEEQCPRRPVKCDLCNKLVPSEEMEHHADRQCTQRFVACPNECGEQIKAAKMDTHLEEHCKLALVTCPYASVGCCWKKDRREKLREHLNDAVENHARLQVAALEQSRPSKDTKKVRWKLENARERIEDLEDDEAIDSPSFTSLGYNGVQSNLFVYVGHGRFVLGIELRPHLESTDLCIDEIKFSVMDVDGDGNETVGESKTTTTNRTVQHPEDGVCTIMHKALGDISELLNKYVCNDGSMLFELEMRVRHRAGRAIDLRS